MAFGKIQGTAKAAGRSFPKYTGIAPVKIVAFNPTAKELSELLGREIKEELVYTGKSDYKHPVSGVESKVDSARLTFWLSNEDLGILTNVTFNLLATSFVSKSGSVKVIDEYGRTAWVTEEQFKEKVIPTYSSGPARISKEYKKCLKNQEELITFLKFYLGIPNVEAMYNGVWNTNDNPKDCVISLDGLQDYFKGNFKEIKDILTTATDNMVKVVLGVKLTEGKTYQDVYNGTFIRNFTTKYDYAKKHVEEAQTNGRYPNTIFSFGDPTLYTDNPKTTTKEKPEETIPEEDLPF